MTKLQNSPVPQAPAARKRRNTYRHLAIELYARNSSSVLAITHQHWPDQPWTSQPELARILSRELGWEVDYRTRGWIVRERGMEEVNANRNIEGRS